MFDTSSLPKGESTMTNNEIELINIIRGYDNPEQALMVSLLAVIGFLKQHESFEVQDVACLQGFA